MHSKAHDPSLSKARLSSDEKLVLCKMFSCFSVLLPGKLPLTDLILNQLNEWQEKEIWWLLGQDHRGYHRDLQWGVIRAAVFPQVERSWWVRCRQVKIWGRRLRVMWLLLLSCHTALHWKPLASLINILKTAPLVLLFKEAQIILLSLYPTIPYLVHRT